MKKILTSFLVALSIVAISAFDTSLSTNTSSLQTKQNTLTIMSSFDLRYTGTICVALQNGTVTYASRRYVPQIKKLLGV